MLCLFLAAKGKTSSETADFFETKRSTVESHRKEVLRKLSCRSIGQPIYEGIRYGYLSPKNH